ncbi:uncharacterized protein LOC125047613 [Penaeus chinensis]|uniref:uncharacterized protein LOC125047613 n=1 Tax=Penaeus chinensis TaxID=139456 RepID=UPI001FB657E3|nr:uncharacterized protein LOC125047613 [Penaeus chinensis]
MVAPLVIKQISHNLVKIPKAFNSAVGPNWNFIHATRDTRLPIKGQSRVQNLYLHVACKNVRELPCSTANLPSHTVTETVSVTPKPPRASDKSDCSEGIQASTGLGVKRKAEEQCQDNVNIKRSRATEGS